MPNQTISNLQSKISSPALSRIALLAGAASALPMANASVIYSGVQNINRTNPSTSTYTVDMAADLAGLYTFTAQSNASQNSVTVNTSNSFVGGVNASALTAGTPINSGSTFSTGTGNLLTKSPSLPSGEWSFLGDQSYLGVRFSDPNPLAGSGGPYYGWISIGVSVLPPSSNSTGFTITGWAYENTGTQILAGATTSATPEPSTLALFALGAAGIAALRARRRSA